MGLAAPVKIVHRRSPSLRRQLNQAVFERVLIIEDGYAVSSELAESFTTLLRADLVVSDQHSEGTPGRLQVGLPNHLNNVVRSESGQEHATPEPGLTRV